MLRIFRRALCLLAAMLLIQAALAAGVSVKVSADARLYRAASTASESVSLAEGTRLTVKAHSGEWARVSYRGLDGYVPVKYLTTTSASASNPSWKSRVTKISWNEGGSGVLKKGKYGYIYDIDTGIVVHIKRTGGTGHADCEPAGKSDTAKLKRISGGGFNWDSHAVILSAGGKFVACAISTKPCGEQTITGNGYAGQFCLYMPGSRDHEGEPVGRAHEKSIARAYKWAH